jgi:hypothetical protein
VADPGFAKAFAEIFEKVVKSVPDIADAHLETVGDFLILEVLKIFHAHHGLIAFLHFRDEQLDHADGLHFPEFAIRSFEGRLALTCRFIEGFTFVFAEDIEGKITDTSEKPGAGDFDLVPMLVEFEKSILHHFFGKFTTPQEPEGIAEERTLLIGEDLFE